MNDQFSVQRWRFVSDHVCACPPHRSDRLLESCSIALVGKYTKFADSYTSVIKALEHSALAVNQKLEIKVIQPAPL